MRAAVYEANHTYGNSERKEMKQYINRGLVTKHGASTKGRPKPLANIQVVKDVLYFLWACDEYVFKHSRVRVQLSFAILVMAYQGLRPGEFVESSAYRGSNEGLKYRDITLTAILSEGGIRWVLQVTIRNRKNHRNKESGSIVHLLTDQPGNPFLCPVTHYCALALADNAFAKIKSVDDLYKINRRADIRIKPEEADVPIFRALTTAGQISNENILSVDSLDSLLVGLGRRAGYKVAVTAYCFRRGFRNTVVDKVTSVQRRQCMGHKSDDTFLNYISNRSGVDTQSIVLGRDQQTDIIDFVRSMAIKVNQSAPVPHGSRLTHARRRYSEGLASCDAVWQPNVDENDQDFLTVPKMSTRQHYEVRRRARRFSNLAISDNFELNPPIKSSISRIRENQWLVGQNHICELRDLSLPSENLCYWLDPSGRTFQIRTFLSPPATVPVEPFCSASASAAVWEFAGLIWKVKSWVPGVEDEAHTINFVKNTFPLIPIPEIVYHWNEELANRSFMAMKRAPGETLDSSRCTLSDPERKTIASELADYIVLLATVRRPALLTISGYGVTDNFTQRESHKPSWRPSTLHLQSHEQAVEYFHPLKVDKEFVFTHGDINPKNLLIADGRISCILDWEIAGFLPKWWINIKARILAMSLSNSELPHSWIDVIKRELEYRGITVDLDAYLEWDSKTRTRSR